MIGVMKRTTLVAGTILAVFLCTASLAFAHGHRVVTAPYWCGTYYSSYPCAYQPYSTSYSSPTSYSYPYNDYYYDDNYSTPYYGYVYPPFASPSNGYCPTDYFYSGGLCYSDENNSYMYNNYPYSSYGSYSSYYPTY